MAEETTFDNEGVKSGLKQITFQLLETNKLLAEQGKPNLFKAFKENQAEVLASFAISKMQMDQQQRIADAVSQDPGTVKLPRDQKGRALARRPAEGDTLYGLMAKLVNIQGDRQDIIDERFEKQKKLEAEEARKEEKRYQQLTKIDEDKRTTDQQHEIDEIENRRNVIDVQREEIAQRKKDSRKFIESLRRGFTGLKSPMAAQAKMTRSMQRLIGKGLLIRAKLLKRNFEQGKIFEKIGKSFGKFFTTNKKDKKDSDGLLMKGLKGLGNKIGSLFGKFFGGLGFILKTAAAILSIGLIFKFLDSDYWKKIKPNIGQIIAESVIVAEGVVNFLINVIKDILIPSLMGLAKLFVFVVKEIGGLFGIQYGEGKRREIEEDVRGDEEFKTEADIQKEIKRRVDLQRMLFEYDNAYDLGDALLFRSFEDVRKRNQMNFETMMGEGGASIGGYQILPNDFEAKMGDMKTFITKGGDKVETNNFNSKNVLIGNNNFVSKLYLEP